MDEERAEHMSLYRWDLSSDVGFELITYRSVNPQFPDMANTVRRMLPLGNEAAYTATSCSCASCAASRMLLLLTSAS